MTLKPPWRLLGKASLDAASGATDLAGACGGAMRLVAANPLPGVPIAGAIGVAVAPWIGRH